MVEIMVALAIVLILATIGVPAFKNVYENANAKVCETNLLAIKTGYDIYKMEHDTMPGSLSEIPYEYFNRGYAKIIQGKDSWKIQLADFIVGLKEQGIAYAGPFLMKLVKGQRKLLVCPSDKRVLEAGKNKISYCLNKKIAGLSAEEAENAIEGEPLVVDCKGDDTNQTSVFDGMNDQIISSPHATYSLVGASSSYSQGVSDDAGTIQVSSSVQASSSQATPANANSGYGWKSPNIERCRNKCDEAARDRCQGNKWSRQGYTGRVVCETTKAGNCKNCFCH
jgi:competence protein ComGC